MTIYGFCEDEKFINKATEQTLESVRDDDYLEKYRFNEQELNFIHSNPEVKVSVLYRNGPYSHWNQTQFDGYYIELLNYIFEKTGVTLKLIPEEELQSHNKEIPLFEESDIVVPMTIDKVALYSFGGHLDLKVNQLIHHNEVGLMSKEKLRNMRPVISKTFSNSYYDKYFEKSLPNYEPNYFGTPTHSLNEILNDSRKFSIMDRPSYEFYKEKYHYHFRKLHAITLTELNEEPVTFPIKKIGYAYKKDSVLSGIIKKITPLIPQNKIMELKEKWLLNYRSVSDEKSKRIIIVENSDFSDLETINSFDLTDNEKKHLDEIEEFNFIILENYPPFSKTTEKGSSGFMIDLVEKMGKQLDREINIIPVPNQKNLQETLSKYKNSFSTTVLSQKNKEDLRLTGSIDSYRYSIISKMNRDIKGLESLSGKTVGIISSIPYSYQLNTSFPKIKFKPINKSEEGLKQVVYNKIDAYIDLGPVLKFYLRKYPNAQISISGHLPFSEKHFAFASSKIQPIELIGIIEKAHRSIPETEIGLLKEKWYTVVIEEITDYTLIFVISGFTGVLILFFIYWSGKLRKLNNIIQEKEIISRSLLETTNAVTYHFNYKTLTFDYIAPQIVKVTGYSVQDIQTRDDWFEKIYEKDRLKSQKKREKGLLSTKDFSLEYRLKKKNGQYIWIRELCTPVIEEETIVATKGLLINVSIEKKHESEIKAAKNAAESANDAKSQFLANMSHEIRTPLNPIIGLAHLALTSNPSFDQVKDYMSKIQSSSKSLLRIINDILDLSKMEANKLSLEMIPLDLSQLKESINNLYGVKALEKNIKLHFEIEKEVNPYIQGDPLRMEQIIGNLVSNAIKYTENGSVKVMIKQSSKNGESQKLYYGVVDTGLGIPEDKLGKIFEVFTQADNSNTRTHGGTGLGLNICQKLIQLMGGELRAKSEIGKGSEFYFSLNQKIVNEDEFNKHRETTFSKYNLPKFKSAKILLAEDNHINKQVAAELLKAVNLNLDHVSNGKECIQAIKDNSYDLVLTDIQMPVMDGFEATKIIRRNSKYKDLPIIAMTAQAFESEKQASLDAGMNDHVTKPIEPIKLYETLAKFLDIEDFCLIEEDVQSEIISIDLDTLDSGSGIRRLRGNVKLYIEILREFHKENEETEKDMTKNLEGENFKICLSKLHQLKGSSANIGALQLQNACQKLEDSLKQNKKYHDNFNQFKYVLSKTLNSILNYLNMINTSSDKNDQQVNDQPLKPKQLLVLLTEQIENASPEAINTVDLLLDTDRSDQKPIISSIKMDLDDFDFESASAKIKNIR